MKKFYILSLVLLLLCISDAWGLTFRASNSDISVRIVATYGRTVVLEKKLDPALINSGKDILAGLTFPDGLKFKDVSISIEPSVSDDQLIKGYRYLGDYESYMTLNDDGSGSAVRYRPLGVDKEHLDAEIFIDNAYLSDLRTAQCTLNLIDTDRTIGRVLTSYVWEERDFEKGENIIRFIPGLENNLSIGFIPEWSEGHIYSVTKNGERVPRGSGGFSMNIKNGDVIDVISYYPDEIFEVQFVETDRAKGAYLECEIINKGTERASTFQAKAGTTLLPITDSSSFHDVTYSIDGHVLDSDFFRYSRLPVDRNPLIVTIDAIPYPRTDVLVTIDDPTHAVLHPYSHTYFPLNEGKNTVSLAEYGHYFIDNSPMGHVTGVSVNGEALTAPYEFDVTEDAKIEIVITTMPTVRNQRALVTADSYDGEMELFSTSYPYPYEDWVLPFETFNNHKLLHFSEQDLDRLWIRLDPDKEFMLDDITIRNGSEWTRVLACKDNDFEIRSLSDGDIIRVHGNGYSGAHEVTLSTDFNLADLKFMSCGYQQLPISKESMKFYEFPNADVYLSIPSNEEAEVKVNDTTLTPGEDGRYMFTVEGPTKVSVMRSVTGIDSIGADTADDAPVYYNLQGIRVDRPTSGTYIVVRPSGITKETIR